jgi:single-strand DNA-binding protein
MLHMTIIGNLGGDPEMRYTPGGSPVCNFNVATKGRRKDKDTGDPITTWVKCTAWGKQAELTSEYLRKGHRVALSGDGGLETFTGRDGGERTVLTCNIAEVEFLTTRAEAEAMSGSRPPAQGRTSQPPPDGDSDLDDLPF